MNTRKVVRELKRKYPRKNVVITDPENPTEVICETLPGKDYSEAIVVIDEIRPHYHKALTETYEIMKGELTHFLGEKKRILKEGESVVIPAGSVHWAEGDEVWFKVTSTPGWTPEDHILVTGASETSRNDLNSENK